MTSKLTFLGSGGGTYYMSTQLRATGGVILELDGLVFHIDPGPGAVVRARQFGVDLGRVDAVLISHGHIDHINDLSVVVAAMTAGYTMRRGILIAADYLSGSVENSFILGPFLANLDKVVPLKPGETTSVGLVDVLATETKHDDVGGVGFVMKGSKQVSYVSDTAYFPELSGWHEGSEVLILNVLKPDGERTFQQLNTEDAIKIIGEISPELSVLAHFGRRMENPDLEAQIAQNKTGGKVVAAKDGLVIDLDKGRCEFLDQPHE